MKRKAATELAQYNPSKYPQKPARERPTTKASIMPTADTYEDPKIPSLQDFQIQVGIETEEIACGGWV